MSEMANRPQTQGRPPTVPSLLAQSLAQAMAGRGAAGRVHTRQSGCALEARDGVSGSVLSVAYDRPVRTPVECGRLTAAGSGSYN